ncbi:hypothetical protein AB5I41_01515 [Sphingomonas sp. MMS24-JH45]
MSNLTGLTVNSGARTYTFDGSAAAGSFGNALTETDARANNSPRNTALTVAAALGARTKIGVLGASRQRQNGTFTDAGTYVRTQAMPAVT